MALNLQWKHLFCPHSQMSALLDILQPPHRIPGEVQAIAFLPHNIFLGADMKQYVRSLATKSRLASRRQASNSDHDKNRQASTSNHDKNSNYIMIMIVYVIRYAGLRESKCEFEVRTHQDIFSSGYPDSSAILQQLLPCPIFQIKFYAFPSP